MVQFRFDQEKALASLLYVAEKLRKHWGARGPTLHKVFKIIYFADQKHLTRYGRPIIGDTYIAMRDGPVPSRIYDIVKSVRGDSVFWNCMDFSQYFNIESDRYIFPKTKPDLDEFSESDLECLNESFDENKSLGFGQLKIKSHDDAYKNSVRDDAIDYEKIAKAGGAKRAIVQYMNVISENQHILKYRKGKGGH